jgi:hypothetical protein
VVSTSNAELFQPFLAAFRRGLAKTGLAEGRDVTLAIHHLDGDVDRLPALAEAVVAARPRVIVASSPAAAIALRRASGVIPIVMATSVDPVAAGLAASLARPGGNVTGLSGQELDVVEKQLGLIPDLLPRARRVLGLGSAAFLPLGEALGDAFTAAAVRLGLESRIALVDPRPDLPALRAGWPRAGGAPATGSGSASASPRATPRSGGSASPSAATTARSATSPTSRRGSAPRRRTGRSSSPSASPPRPRRSPPARRSASSPSRASPARSPPSTSPG